MAIYYTMWSSVQAIVERERITSTKQRGRTKKETAANVADEKNEEL